MNCKTNELVDIVIIQKGQFQGELEKQACQLLLDILVNEVKLDIGTFVTDRHVGISSMMRIRFPDIFHAFDIWHMAKSLQKKLTAAAKTHPKIGLWTGSLVNHFWWCCKECKGDTDLLLEMFHSCLFHVLNIHNWGRRRKIHDQLRNLRVGTRPYPTKPLLVKQCYHVHLDVGSSETTTWFEVDDSDFKALFKVICATKFSNDTKKCCNFVHTGNLESFHNLKLMYLPKSTGFTMTTTIIMTMLTAIQSRVYLEQKNSAKVHHVAQWSRASKKHVVKKRTEYDAVSFKKTIIGEVNSNLISNAVLDMDLTPYIRQPVPKTFHGETAPPIDELLARRLTRMS